MRVSFTVCAMSSDDEDRAAILARRSRLIGLALSGLAAAACDEAPGPTVCLEPPIVQPDEGDPSPPMPCLSPPMPPEPTGEAEPAPERGEIDTDDDPVPPAPPE